ncbi:sensor histidine kinase [Cohnella herbarum]|uniref:histidine kinase n=1 Tax=Cohnella herbarum TaxID=2728023 RepID=A0A7Z2VL10_9BACL|nr:sensor histidine kinase [Cohnella herbarum]QJD84910.1 sensor histidine kinase [Cohnella herbarum]
MRQKELEAQTEAVDGVAKALDQQMDKSQEIVLRLYQNKAFLNDMLFFLRNDLPHYIQYRFNEYITSNTTEDRNVETFIRSHMESNRDIVQIAIYSRDQSFLFVFNKNKTQKLLMLQNEKKDIVARAVDSMQYQKKASGRTSAVDRILGIENPGAYTFGFELNDPDTLQNEGALLVTYQPDTIREMFESGRERLMGSHLVLLSDGKVIHDSSGRYIGQIYPYFRQLSTSPGDATLEVKSFTTTMRTVKSDIYVSGIIPLSEMKNRYAGFKGRLIAVTVVGILTTITFAYIAVYRYAKRTRSIVKAMKLAQQGNLTVRVPTGRADELDEISFSFNRMCEELSSYINQVYVSEIKQKHAEIVAFQAQINPHFLYNTLEAIRMRAMTLGAADVGEMAYVLGALFRYAVRADTVVSLRDEADNCRQFLELYKIRYKEKIDYRIEIEERIESARLFKLLLQPIVENAIVHGIRQTKHGNLITIRAFAEGASSMIVEIEDNGKGMEPEKHKTVTDSILGQSNPGSSSSLGLRNVNERIRLVYGVNYGLDIRSKRGEGTVVRIRLPFEKGEH